MGSCSSREGSCSRRSESMIKVFFSAPPRTIPLDVKGSDTIKMLKAKIQDKEGMSINRQRLFKDGRQCLIKDGLGSRARPRPTKNNKHQHTPYRICMWFVVALFCVAGRGGFGSTCIVVGGGAGRPGRP